MNSFSEFGSPNENCIHGDPLRALKNSRWDEIKHANIKSLYVYTSHMWGVGALVYLVIETGLISSLVKVVELIFQILITKHRMLVNRIRSLFD